MSYQINSSKRLNNNQEIPRLGLGVFQAEDGNEVKQAVLWALEQGYRLIDTAAIYDNEKGVGDAIAESGIAREEIFITTKLWNTDIRNGNFKDAFEKSMENLGLEYLDLYLLHWPTENRLAAWDYLCKLNKSGIVKSIGVSNFMITHLKELLEQSFVIPAVNQVEFHPYLQSPELVEFCKAKDIIVQAWSPIMRGQSLKDPALLEIAKKHNKTAAQIILRWDLQKEILTIPKSIHQDRIQENSNIFDFELDEEDMRQIAKLDQNVRNGPDPMNFSF